MKNAKQKQEGADVRPDERRRTVKVAEDPGAVPRLQGHTGSPKPACSVQFCAAGLVVGDGFLQSSGGDLQHSKVPCNSQGGCRLSMFLSVYVVPSYASLGIAGVR